MKRFIPVFYFLILLTLNIACAQIETNQGNQIGTEANNFASSSNSQTDSLRFTSGIRSILHDSKGNYWLGSHREGVCRFDGASFEYFTTLEGLADNQVRSIQEDQNGDIWFGTANGVSTFDVIKKTIQTLIPDNHLQLRKADTDLWFNAGNNSGAYRSRGQILNYFDFPVPILDEVNNSFGVTGISKGKDGTVWIATYAALFYFDGIDMHRFDQSNLALKEGELLHIRSVFADSQGRIWVGNNGIGVLRIQENSGINFSEKMGLIHAKSSKNGDHSPPGTLEHVFAMAEDAEGNIWFGDRDTGPWKFDGKTMSNYTINNKLSKPMIWCIYKDKNNDLLFGMEDGEVFKFNGKSFEKRF